MMANSVRACTVRTNWDPNQQQILPLDQTKAPLLRVQANQNAWILGISGFWARIELVHDGLTGMFIHLHSCLTNFDC